MAEKLGLLCSTVRLLTSAEAGALGEQEMGCHSEW